MMKKLIFSAIFMIAFSFATLAQVTANANARATIITPITITKVVDMDFGNVAVSDVAGTVILNPDGTRTTTGGVILPSVNGNVTSAEFDTGGMANYTYTITLPTTVQINFGNRYMVVNNFKSNPINIGTLKVNGKDVIKVGATLNVNANQDNGTYNGNTGFNVTVNYN